MGPPGIMGPPGRWVVPGHGPLGRWAVAGSGPLGLQAAGPLGHRGPLGCGSAFSKTQNGVFMCLLSKLAAWELVMTRGHLDYWLKEVQATLLSDMLDTGLQRVKVSFRSHDLLFFFTIK